MNTRTIQTKLESNVIQLYGIESLIGKEVIISIVEMPNYSKKKKRKWNYLGALDLKNAMDKTNIRDLAYE